MGLSKRAVLVTGGAGYIGSHIVLALQAAGWPVAVIDDFSTGSRERVPDDVPLHHGTITDLPLLSRIFEDHEIGAIIHCAGSIVVPDSVSDPLFYYANNTLGSHTLISAAVTAGIRYILFSSTAAIYGIPKRVPVEEDDPARPINPYGHSKMMTEQMLRDAAAAHDVNYGILRYFNVAGADPEGRSGQAGPGSTHLIKVAIEAALGIRKGVQVYGQNFPTADGTGVRDFIHVSDLADAHVATLEYLVGDGGRNLTANCGYGRGHSVIEVLDAVDKVAGVKLQREYVAPRAGDPPELVSSNKRLVETVHWSPKYPDLEKIVAHALAWERQLQQRRK